MSKRTTDTISISLIGIDVLGSVAAAGRECDIPSAPPAMQLRCEDIFKILSTAQHHLHPNSRILSEGQILIFKRLSRQNTPVLQTLEMACSRRQHPLSSVSGRRRYNTLDFPTENRVPTGCFRPYWKPRIKGICHPFEISARLCICTHKQRKRVCEHRSINAKNPRALLP